MYIFTKYVYYIYIYIYAIFTPCANIIQYSLEDVYLHPRQHPFLLKALPPGSAEARGTRRAG